MDYLNVFYSLASCCLTANNLKLSVPETNLQSDTLFSVHHVQNILFFSRSKTSHGLPSVQWGIYLRSRFSSYEGFLAWVSCCDSDDDDLRFVLDVAFPGRDPSLYFKKGSIAPQVL